MALAVFLQLITNAIKRPGSQGDRQEWNLFLVRHDDGSLGVVPLDRPSELGGLVARVDHYLQMEVSPGARASQFPPLRQRYACRSVIQHFDFDDVPGKLTEDEKQGMWSLIQPYLAEEYRGTATEADIIQNGRYEYLVWWPGAYYYMGHVGCNASAMLTLIWAVINLYGFGRVMRRQALGRCSNCGYDLRGTVGGTSGGGGMCPECGATTV